MIKKREEQTYKDRGPGRQYARPCGFRTSGVCPTPDCLDSDSRTDVAGCVFEKLAELMTLHDDDIIRKPVSHEIGAKLDVLSVEELDQRIILLKAEISRLEAAKAKKQGALIEAQSFFKM